MCEIAGLFSGYYTRKAAWSAKPRNRLRGKNMLSYQSTKLVIDIISILLMLKTLTFPTWASLSRPEQVKNPQHELQRALRRFAYAISGVKYTRHFIPTFLKVARPIPHIIFGQKGCGKNSKRGKYLSHLHLPPKKKSCRFSPATIGMSSATTIQYYTCIVVISSTLEVVFRSPLPWSCSMQPGRFAMMFAIAY